MGVSNIPATVAEAARAAQCSEDTVRRAYDAGRLTGIRLSSGLRLIDRAALEAFARQRAARRPPHKVAAR